jgi:hypothetical protein
LLTTAQACDFELLLISAGTWPMRVARLSWKVSWFEPAQTSPMPAPYVTIALAATLTDYSEKAIRRKIQDGVWLEGRGYRKSP